MSDVRKTVQVTLLLGLAAGLLALAGLRLEAESTQQPTPLADQLVGSETCLACHSVHPALFRTPHGEMECEDCHGPGGLHVESGGEDRSIGFSERAPKAFSDACLQCHNRSGALTLFRISEHGRGGISCGSCHQLHSEEPGFSLLAGPQLDLCSGCHPAVRAAFRKPFHHPVLEGAMECVDCHNPHGGDRASLRRFNLGAEENCTVCHTEKNGPFVFEHAPLQVSSCGSCHEPHGGINPRMLRRTQVRQLCLECHSRSAGLAGSQPPSFHDLRSPRFQNCTTCHREIHGSNVSPLFLR